MELIPIINKINGVMVHKYKYYREIVSEPTLLVDNDNVQIISRSRGSPKSNKTPEEKSTSDDRLREETLL